MTKTCDGEGAGAVVGVGEELGDALAVGVGLAVGCTAATGVGLGCAAVRAGPQAATAITARIGKAMRLASGRWEFHVRPERGGRITSLRLDGEELLDQGIGVDQPTAKSFVEGGAWGWDEIVPNLEPTDELPDHGEAWRLPWEVLDEGLMRCRGRLVPWELQRRIELDEAVKVAYQYRNVGRSTQLAYWCAHPLFRYESGMEIGAEVPSALGEGASTKVFLPAGSVDHIVLGWSSGKRIAVSWDASLTPDVAIWMCNGDIGGYRQIAVEPATASPVLEPGASFTWWLRITPL